MTIPIKDDFANARAIEMYEWILHHRGTFQSRQVPGWSISNLNKLAIKALIDRDLIRIVHFDWPRTYRIGRVVDLERCMDLPSGGNYTGVIRYRVDPAIASQMGNCPNLRQYSI